MVTSTLKTPLATGASPAVARVMAGLRRFGRGLMNALEAVGRQRSAAYLNQVADAHAGTRPDFARRMRDAASGRHFD